MEEGKGERYLVSGRQYGNALLGVRHQEEEGKSYSKKNIVMTMFKVLPSRECVVSNDPVY